MIQHLGEGGAAGPAMSRGQIDDLPDPCFATDAVSGRIIAWNPAAARLTGFPETDALGFHCATLLEGVDHASTPVCTTRCPHLALCRGGTYDNLSAERAGGHTVGRTADAQRPHPDMLIRTADGSRRSVVVMAIPAVVADHPALVHLLRSVDDLEHDPLTGALTRDGFVVRLVEEQRRADRERAPLALALVDVDDLKPWNDTAGHAAGDRALRIVASMLGGGPQTDRVARWGGDEFAVLMPSTTLEAATVRLWRSLARVRAASRTEDIPVTFSGGVTEALPGEPWRRAMNRVEAALEDAKRAGKAQVQALPHDSAVDCR
jgi:diguanylate cyclase (GGDEF)-like protein